MENESVKLSNKAGIYTLIMACRHFGVEEVIISPGSRNAPLTVSFNRSKLFRCHSIADERTAAFYALGMVLATQKPVAIICTSGSAAANFAPALTEAFYLKAPVIAITADRPLAWTDQGNGQTIRQEGLYDNFTVDAFTLISEPESHDEIWLNRRRLSTCFSNALVKNRGPVHINVPVAEPLYGTQTYPIDYSGFYKKTLSTGSVSPKEMQTFADRFNTGKKVLILVGQMNPNAALEKILESYAGRDNVVILTETTANMQLNNGVDTIDRLIMAIRDEELLKELMPDLLITLGGYIVSKKIKSLFREYQPVNHWHIDPYDSGLDTFRSLTDEITAKPEDFLTDLHPHLTKVKSEYRKEWTACKEEAAAAHQSYLRDLPYSDFYAFREILQSASAPLTIHMANSSPVRYVQLFGTAADVNYYGNRGTSGIDGCSSTAAGFASMDPDTPNLLITGDTAFMYDSNALWNRNFPKNLKIIVVNNSGGGIFRIIEGPNTTEELEEYFEAFHPVEIESIAAAHHIPFFSASSTEELTKALPAFFAKAGAALLEIKTPAEVNPKILRKYFNHIGKHISLSKSKTGTEPRR